MRRWTVLSGIILLGMTCANVQASDWALPGELARCNRSIRGQVLDFTHNHGKDRRIWSAALCEKRDLYVYLPPGYDPSKKYPLAIFLHGAGQDEQIFLKSLVRDLDCAMVQGKLPPAIVAAPDGSFKGRTSVFHIATFFANSDAGRFEDYLQTDVWDFLTTNFPIHAEREAHWMFGVSMGGGAAFTQAMRYKHRYKVAIGFMPALNMRWVDCHGRYNAPFDPDCWGWRTERRPLEVIGRPKVFVKVRFGMLTNATIGRGPDALEKLSRDNPIEVMDALDLQPGELDFYVAYGGKDEFNIPAQAESFLYRANQRGIQVGVGYDPRGHHDEATARKFLPGAYDWIAPRTMPYFNDVIIERR